MAAAKGPVDESYLKRKEREFMKANGRRSAFTLIEVLIVVIIMALLAATVIPQLTSTTTDAKKSALEFNLHTIRSQIQLYRAQHNAFPTVADFENQMTLKTTLAGLSTGDDADLIYGPYIQGNIPKNPFNNSSTVVAVGTAKAIPTAAVGGGTTGWQYDVMTGGFYPNNTEYYAAP
jgi:type II secretion system protein G